MKHLIHTLLALTLFPFALTACGGDKGDQPAPQPNSLVGTWNVVWLEVKDDSYPVHLVADYAKDTYALTIKGIEKNGKISQVQPDNPLFAALGGGELIPLVMNPSPFVLTADGIVQTTIDKVMQELFYEEKGNMVNFYEKSPSGVKGNLAASLTITQDQRTSGYLLLQYKYTQLPTLDVNIRVKRTKF